MTIRLDPRSFLAGTVAACLPFAARKRAYLPG
jgi:hypothetical protein